MKQVPTYVFHFLLFPAIKDKKFAPLRDYFFHPEIRLTDGYWLITHNGLSTLLRSVPTQQVLTLLSRDH